VFEHQVAIPVVYRGERIECGYRADFVIEGALLVELKSVDRVAPIHQAQVLTYLKLLSLGQGLLLNFNVVRLVDGLTNLLL
jgi:GxxExxY protein